MSFRSTPSDSSNPPRCSKTVRGVWGEACTCHGAALACGDRHRKVPRFSLSESHEEMACGSAQTQNDPTVLDSVVGVEKPRSNHANVGSLHLTADDVQPSRGQGFDVVVQEHQDVTGCFRGRRIVQYRPVEGAIISEHSHVRTRGEPFEKRDRLRLIGAVIDQKVLRSNLCGGLLNRFEAGPKKSRFIPEWDDDAGRRSHPWSAADPDRAWSDSRKGHGMLSTTLECGVHMLPGSGSLSGHRGLGDAAVTKDFRDMADEIGRSRKRGVPGRVLG